MGRQRTFISYRSLDGRDMPYHLCNYLNNKGIDTFCDQNEPANQRPILDKLRQEIMYSDHLVVLLTDYSLSELITYCDKRIQSKLHYVYEELSAAAQSGCIIIPVYLCPDKSVEELEQLNRTLFVDKLHCADGYHFVHQEKGMTDHELFEKILCCTEAKPVRLHTDLSDLYWVGTRMTDVENIGPFRGYIVFFGESGHENSIIMCSEKTGLRVDHNDSSDLSQDEFILCAVASILKREPKARFMFYNPSTVYRLGMDEKYGKEHFVCLNDVSILNQVNDKRCFRQMMKDIVPMLPVVECTRVNCDYDDLITYLQEGYFEDKNDYGVPVPDIKYDSNPKFIVQAPISSGGSGTFVLSRENARFILSSLDPRAKYMVSVYYTKNIAVNIHVLIEDNRITLLPASIQLEREVEEENKLLYKGADFPAYFQIDVKLRMQFEKQARKVAIHLQERGYRGVLGVDAIIHDGRVNVTEVNGRFQASTELINRTFEESGYKTIHELNYEIFCNGNLNETDYSNSQSIRVPYSNYSFSYEGRTTHFDYIYRRALQLTTGNTKNLVVSVQPDGYRFKNVGKYSAQAYLFRVIFFNSIASVSEDGTVWINENICDSGRWLRDKIKAREKLAVKIALLIQGIRIDGKIHESLREATNNAVDLMFGTGKDLMVINAPTNIRHVGFSPFELRMSNNSSNHYSLYYYDKLLIESVGVFPTDKNQNLKIMENGRVRHSFSEIAYLSTDRLRVHLTNACMYKQMGKGCQFCNIPIENSDYPIEEYDVKKVLEKYIEDRETDKKENKPVCLEHFLIGGQSLNNGDQQLITIAKVLEAYHLPIYVMSLPLKKETVEELVRCGVHEFAYNIEIFNEKCRKKYMPGKSMITLDGYMSALKMTKYVLNANRKYSMEGVVRSMVIVGLEPYDDMIEGIKNLITIGVEPMLSVFRPLPNTNLEHLNAPPIKMVYELFFTISRMLFDNSGYRPVEQGGNRQRWFRKLGPECKCCQNNTVSLPWEMQRGKQVYTDLELDREKVAF